jgi:hypothetical protein
MGAALTTSVCTDGQTPMAANLPMGNNKITGLAPATLSTDALQYGQLSASGGSYIVGFIQSGTGAIAHFAQDKLREHVSAFDFMTVAQIADVQAGTLLVDVTAALQAAITAIAAKNPKGALYLPAGRYRISAPLQIPYGVSIFGVGATAAEIVCYDCDGLEFVTYGYEIGSMFYENFGLSIGSGTNRSAIVAPANAATMDGLYFNRLRFYGWNECFNLAANWSTAITYCTAQNINCFVAASAVIVGLRIRNNRAVYGAGGAGTADKYTVDLRGGTIQESIHIADNNFYGFDANISATNVTVFMNVTGNDLSALVNCIQYTTVSGIFNITDNYIECFNTGILGNPQSVDTPTVKINIQRNGFIGQSASPQIGIQLNSAIGTNQWNTTISDNSFSGFLTHDIKIFAGGRSYVERNRFMSTAPVYSIFMGGILAGPVKLADNWCQKAIYVDVPADVSTGKLILTNNVEGNTFVPYRGTFTPVYSSQAGAFGAITYSYANGAYERVGNLCFFNLTIVETALAVGTAANGAYISLGNIPFTPAATVQATAITVGDATGWGANTPSGAILLSGTKNISMTYRTTANGATAVMQVSDMTAGAGNRITLSGVFLCA